MLTVDFNRLNFKPGYRVLDAGCGPGRHLGEAFRRKGADVVGIDMKFDDLITSKNTLRIMQKEGQDGGGHGLVAGGDITRLPFADNTFDIVICSEVMEHIPDHENAAKEIVRVLKPGSSLVVSVPRYTPERICWALSEEYHNEEGGHVRIYQKKQLIRLLRRAGAQLKGSGTAHALHSPYWWIKCAVGHKNDDAWPAKLYHRFLVWDIMQKPFLTRALDKLLNPIMSKSIVLYLEKDGNYGT